MLDTGMQQALKLNFYDALQVCFYHFASNFSLSAFLNADALPRSLILRDMAAYK